MRVLVLGNAQRPGVKEEAERLLPVVREHTEVVAVDLSQELDLAGIDADICLVLGGDGAILRAARQMGYKQLPVLGVNLGKLGFLADLTPDDLLCCFAGVAKGEYRVTHHLMFECVVEGSSPKRVFLGLNEIAIQSGPPFQMIDLDLIIDGELVSSYAGDGLILSTPIGSTAHNLSAGGPILGQELDAFVITPICSHSLTSRPVVDSSGKQYRITLSDDSCPAIMIVDGQQIASLNAKDWIDIQRAPVTFRLVKVPGRTYYQTLRDKLRWGTTPNYRNEPASEV